MTARQMLVEGAREIGVSLSEAQADACMVYAAELGKWNRRISLTAIRDEREVVVKHFIDSFSFCRGFDPARDRALLDMGSGAGFPAIPIKIAFPGVSVTMVESVGKKASFLRHITRTLQIDGAVVEQRRTEALPGSHHSRYDVITARALSGMELILREGSLFLRPGGRIVLSRGPQESVSEAAQAAAGMTVESRTELVLPFSSYRRTVWVFRKTI